MVNLVLFNLMMETLAGLASFFCPWLLGSLFSQPDLVAYGHLVGLVMLLWIVSSFLEIVPIANQEIKLASVAIGCVQLTRTIFYLAAVLLFGTVRALIYARSSWACFANGHSGMVSAIPLYGLLAPLRSRRDEEAALLRLANRFRRDTAQRGDRPAQLSRLEIARPVTFIIS